MCCFLAGRILFLRMGKLISTLHTAYTYALLEAFLISKQIHWSIWQGWKHFLKRCPTTVTNEMWRWRAKNSIAKSLEPQHTIQLIRELDVEISEIDGQIEHFVEKLNALITSIPGIGFRRATMILAEIGNCLIPLTICWTTLGHLPLLISLRCHKNCCFYMQKRGSRHLRYALYSASKCHLLLEHERCRFITMKIGGCLSMSPFPMRQRNRDIWLPL